MTEFVGPAIEVGKCIVEPIKRQFNYLCCFNTTIQNLRDEAKRLDDAKEGLQRQVEAAKRNTEDIVPEVETWLGNVDKIQENYTSGIEPKILNVKSGCLAIKSRFSLSRKATMMAAAMKELQEDGKFGRISVPAPPAAMSSIPHGQVYELKSRKDFEEDIMTTLREKKVNLMGIYGMGGVGKTTMAKKIMTRARGEGLFDEMVIVVVSQPIDMLRIQKEMAELLGLELKVDSLLARAHLLHARLRNTKSILIILDDLWKGLNLEDLGIPKECMILLTSRDRDVFSAMNVEKTFQMQILKPPEAWSLFKEKVGACADDQSLFSTAQEIVQECKGLPIALVTVGVALKDKMNKSIWEDAVQELRSCNPQDIPDFLAQVYNPLKLSYDLLQSGHAKSIFLLCCLFPEDHNILISNLSLYAWGLGMFEGIRSLQVVRNKVQTLVEMLKSRSLLMDGYNESCVRMHDVVRDVGIFIAAKQGLMDPNLNWKSWAREESDCSWISLFDADKITLPGGSVFPNLRFLLIEGQSYQETDPLCDNLFQGTRKLNVLSIKIYEGMRSLPHTIQLQKNMRTLILHNCSSLEDISVVGELVSLEILSCRDCHGVTELPVEIGRLNQLKLLEILHCFNLNTIKAGVISRLIRLEVLTLIGSFIHWELTVEEGKNAAVRELNFLSSLTTLKIHILDTSLAAEQIHLPNLVEFDITFGHNQMGLSSYGRQMVLELEREVIIGDWIHQLLRSTEKLVLRGEGSSKLLQLVPQFRSLKQLSIYNAKITRLSDGTATVFSLLNRLVLGDNDDLEEIHKPPISSDYFNNLSSIYIIRCPRLRSVLPCAMGKYSILQLERLTIKSCRMLEQVVLWKEEEIDQSSSITFPKLEFLTLHNLPRLTTLCKGIDSIGFPTLSRMEIVKCPNLKSLVSSTKNDHKTCLDDDSLHLFCKPAAFGRLKYLTANGYDGISILWCDQIPIDFFTELVDLNVSKCDNIKSLFSPSIAGNLVNLKCLIIKSCREMVKVIEDKGDNVVERSPFVNLVRLELEDLPKLKDLCDWGCGLQLPSLRQVVISKCPLMERFLYGSLICSNSFKDLKSIKIKSCLMLEHVMLWSGEDINGRITFPKLDVLSLWDLPRLTSLGKGIQSIEFPLLTQMEIVNCPNMKSVIFSTENAFSGATNHDAEDSLHLFCKSEAAFGKLKGLKVDGYGSISSDKSLSLWCGQIPFDFFTGLEVLKVKNCGNIKSLFSQSIAGKLVNLRALTIKSCREMVKVIEEDEENSPIFIKLKVLKLKKLSNLEIFCNWRCALQLPLLEEIFISECPQMKRFSPFSSDSLNSITIESCLILEQVMFWNEGENGKDINRITFTKLDELLLRDLPRLTSFCKGIQSIEFPLLTVMEIKNCPNMKTLVSSNKKSSGAINRNAHDSLHLFCKSQAAFGKLEDLILDGYGSINSDISLSLWCDHIPFAFFTGIEVLKVKNCGNIKSLFSPSIAGKLVNLRVLTIKSCHEMVKIIEEDEDKSSPVFIKLKVLKLKKLPSLKVFCDWRCALQLSSLKEVVISECHRMERFSFGSLTTPNLKKISVNTEDITNYTKDLNDAPFVGGLLHLDILFGSDE